MYVVFIQTPVTVGMVTAWHPYCTKVSIIQKTIRICYRSHTCMSIFIVNMTRVTGMVFSLRQIRWPVNYEFMTSKRHIS